MLQVFRCTILWPLRYRYKVYSLCAIYTPRVYVMYICTLCKVQQDCGVFLSLAIFTSPLFTCQAISTIFSFSSSSLFTFSHVVPSRCDSVLCRLERKKGSYRSLLCHSCSQSSRTSVNGKCVCDVHRTSSYTSRLLLVSFVSRTTLHSCAFLPKKAVYS